MITIIAFDFEHKREKTLTPAEAPQAVAGGMFCWIDMDHEEVSAVCPLLQSMGFDRNIVAEVLSPERLSMYGVFPGCLHFAVREARSAAGVLTVAPLDVLVNKGCLATFHPDDVQLIDHIKRTCREDFVKFSKSPGFLLYELADHLVTGYRTTLLGFSEAVESLQLKLFGEVDDDIFKQVSALTRDILTFRRVILAAREMMHELASRRSPFISETTQPFLVIMAGTLERLGNDLTTERDVLTETLNLYMGMVSHRSSKQLKRLTMISVIFLPLTFLCGVYGMNFKYMPEIEWKYSYPVFWLVVLTLTASLLGLMRWRKWI